MVDQTLQLTATITDAAGNLLTGRVVTWSSSDTALATVDSTGLVKGVAQGQVTMTGSSENRSGSSAITVSGSATGNVTVYTDPGAFQRATAGLGTPTIVNFDNVDARPVNDTIAGRTPFNGSHYAGQGFTFASPDGYMLYIAPGGIGSPEVWNASNSLSVGRFPFDPLDIGPVDPADSLSVTLNPGCNAVSFQLVDNATRTTNEGVEFFGASGSTLQKAELPANYTTNRAFLGLVSTAQVILKNRLFP